MFGYILKTLYLCSWNIQRIIKYGYRNEEQNQLITNEYNPWRNTIFRGAKEAGVF